VGCQIVRVYSVHCYLGSIPTTHSQNQQSVFDRLSFTAQTSKRLKSLKKKLSEVPDLSAASVNMTSRGNDQQWAIRRRQGVKPPSFSSRDSDYSPGLGQILVRQEGTFQGTNSRVARPFNYDQPSSSGGAISPEPLRHMFQWLDEKEEGSDYASSSTIISI